MPAAAALDPPPAHAHGSVRGLIFNARRQRALVFGASAAAALHRPTAHAPIKVRGLVFDIGDAGITFAIYTRVMYLFIKLKNCESAYC